MALIEQITNMKRQGASNEDVINQLAQQGVSPQEILSALKQAEIKNAVTGYPEESEMQPSMMPGGEAQMTQPPQYAEQPYQPPQEYQQQYAPQPTQGYAPQQEQYYAPEQGYSEYSPQGGANTDTMMEIADQIFSEKIKKIQKVVDATSEAAILLQNKFENISDRVKKIENIIDKLQIAILEKVGSYGATLGEVKKEMSMMQDSFSKMVSSSRHKEETSAKK